jgi:hypothetical protein
MMHTTEQNARQLVQNFNSRNLDRAVAQFADNATFQFPGMEVAITGKDAIRAFLKDGYTAFPDWRMDVSKIIISGGETIVVHSVHGTHTGPWVGGDGIVVPPTSRKFTQDQLTRVTFNNTDQILTYRGYGNPGDITRQLGLPE